LEIILLPASFSLKLVIKPFSHGNHFLILLISVLILTYELVSIFENIYSINPNLFFLTSLIRLSKKLNKKAIEVAEGKIDGADVEK